MTRILTGLARAGLALAALMLGTGLANAEYPDRPIKIMLGFPAGGGADILGRWYAEKLHAVSGATVILENKPGANGNLATDAVAKAKPDGYTLLLAASATTAGNTYLYKDLPFDVVKDLAPVTTLNQLGFALAINPQKTPVKTVAELTEFLKKKGGKATYGWSVTTALASAVLYTSSEGIEAVPVNYKATGATVSDVAAGEIDFTFADMVYTLGQEKQGKVKILAVTSGKRASAAPHIPTMIEAGVPKAEQTPWWAMWAPAKTPPEVIDKLSKWMNQVVAMPETRDFLVSQGSDPLPGSPDALKQKLAESLESWKTVTTLAKISPQ